MCCPVQKQNVWCCWWWCVRVVLMVCVVMLQLLLCWCQPWPSGRLLHSHAMCLQHDKSTATAADGGSASADGGPRVMWSAQKQTVPTMQPMAYVIAVAAATAPPPAAPAAAAGAYIHMQPAAHGDQEGGALLTKGQEVGHIAHRKRCHANLPCPEAAAKAQTRKGVRLSAALYKYMRHQAAVGCL